MEIYLVTFYQWNLCSCNIYIVCYTNLLLFYSQVDIFSFAIWLYELLTGYRPFRENRTSAEIRKAVHSGARPSLQNVHVDSKMPFLEALMQVL